MLIDHCSSRGQVGEIGLFQVLNGELQRLRKPGSRVGAPVPCLRAGVGPDEVPGGYVQPPLVLNVPRPDGAPLRGLFPDSLSDLREEGHLNPPGLRMPRVSSFGRTVSPSTNGVLRV